MLFRLLFLFVLARTDVRRLRYETIYYRLVLAKVDNNDDEYISSHARNTDRWDRDGSGFPSPPLFAKDAGGIASGWGLCEIKVCF